MENSTFTVEFPEHLPREKWQYILDGLAQTGASIEQKGDRTFVVLCTRKKHLEHVGWALFHTHYPTKCKVIATSGATVAEASAYPHPPPVRHSK